MKFIVPKMKLRLKNHDGNPNVSDEEGLEMPESDNDTPTGKVVKTSRIDDRPSDALDFILIEKFIPPRNITCDDCMAQPKRRNEKFYKYMKENWCYNCDSDHGQGLDFNCNYDNPHCIAFVYKHARSILYWKPDKLIKKANKFFSEWEYYKIGEYEERAK